MKILLIGGKAGAGKNTVADIIKKNFDNVNLLAFATRVKDTAYFMGWDGQKDERGRKLLQHIGAVGREYYKDTWANDVAWLIKSKSLSKGDSLFVVTDFRFPNEYQVLNKAFPHSVYTMYVTGRQANLGEENSKDVSENSLDDFVFDFVIDNSGSKEALEDEVISVLRGEPLCISSK